MNKDILVLLCVSFVIFGMSMLHTGSLSQGEIKVRIEPASPLGLADPGSKDFPFK